MTSPASDSRSARPAPWIPPTAEELSALLPQYEITAMLGRGGMGAVYMGKQISLDRPVAIKILSGALEDSEFGFKERFKNEAKAMARLNHPGIVSVYAFGETENGLLYIVMEFVDGTDVSRMIASEGRLHSEDAIAITAHVCDALAYAHDRGIIHRDIKPANIMVGHDGGVRVADFGLAKVHVDGTTLGLTMSGVAMGTMHYIAPESMMPGITVDHRADLYAVGVMLYQMLTGRLPRGIFELPSTLVPGLDPRYDDIISKAMQEDRDLRYASAADLRADLDGILTRPVPVVELSAEPVPRPRSESSALPSSGKKPSRPSRVILLTLSGIALLAPGGWWIVSRPGPETPVKPIVPVTTAPKPATTKPSQTKTEPVAAPVATVPKMPVPVDEPEPETPEPKTVPAAITAPATAIVIPESASTPPPPRTSPVPPADAPKPGPDLTAVHQWNDVKGRMIEARFIALSGSNVVLEMSGKTYPYPLADLSPESQKLAMSLHGGPPPEAADTSFVPGRLSLDLSLEDDRTGLIIVELGSTDAVLLRTFPTPRAMLDCSRIAAGKSTLYLRSQGYASQAVSVEIDNGNPSPSRIQARLYRLRYVIIRSAFNMAKGRELTGPNVKHLRQAYTHWAGPRYNGQTDWRIWQGRSDAQGSQLGYGDAPWIETWMHHSGGYGLYRPDPSESYGSMTLAPESGYKLTDFKAEKGLTLYFHQWGNAQEQVGFGKLVVEDITETPPPGVEVLRR